ncbi:MAG TPA: CoA transferase [Candidatus Binataceae bacterium]|nr:CoA transferase [Candidatus Binataceae bacterium]
MTDSGPLAGFRIVDATQMVSGPMATMILADQGADVVKVEPPAIGDLTRAMGSGSRGLSPIFAVINRNKRSIAIDLKNPRGLAVLKRLVSTADVFVQNFRPGRAGNLGIGEADLRAVKSNLVYVSISGFGERGPYVNKRVYDPVIQALSGLASVQADYRTGRPQMMRLIVPDKVTALTAGQAITAALLKRERTGQGSHVRLAMLDAVIAFLWPEAMATYTFGSPSMPTRAQSRDLIFETADGYITAGAVSDAEWDALAHVLGHPEWIDDPRFKTIVARNRNVAERLELTAEALRTKTSAQWLAALEAGQVPSAPVLSRGEVLLDPQVIENDLIMESTHPYAGPMRMPRMAARFDDSPQAAADPAPLLGEHTDEILREAKFGPEEIRQLRESKAIA